MFAKKKAMKRVWPNIFQAFRNQNQIFFVFSFGPNPDPQVSLKASMPLLPRHDPTAKKHVTQVRKCFPPFSLQFFWNVTMTTTPQNPSKPSKTSKSHHVFSSQKKGQTYKIAAFKLPTLCLGRNLCHLFRSRQTNGKIHPPQSRAKDSKEGQEGNLPTTIFQRTFVMDVKFLFVGCLDGWIGETCGEVDVQFLPTNGWCATFKNFYLHLVQIFPNLGDIPLFSWKT